MHADQLRNDARPTMVCSADDLAIWGNFPIGLRVLLLDEDRQSAEETRLKLEALDYIVFSYYNEKDASESIRKKAESFHVAIIEATSGNSDQTFKFLEMAKDLPTVVISNVGCLSTMMKCIGLGAAEVVEKPLPDHKLRNIWQHVVHKAFNAENTNDLLIGLRNSDAKSVNNACNNSSDVITKLADSPSGAEEAVSEEADSGNGSKTKESSPDNEKFLYSSPLQNVSPVEPCREDPGKENSHISTESHATFVARKNSHSYGSRGNIKKMKVDWTPELHRQFVKAVEQLGIDQAIPSKILELMKVKGLTRHNVASHLQKFRMHKRHILPKDAERRCQAHREAMPRDHMQKPVMAFPPFFQHYNLPIRQVHPAWSHLNFFTSGYQMWQYSGFQPWHPPGGSWNWQSYTGINADAWGCPIYHPYSHYSQAEEVINEVVKEAMSKPWLPLPLPLGLKPPSTDSVLAELHRQGIRTVPPPRTAM